MSTQEDAVRNAVRDAYAGVATKGQADCCSSTEPSCCDALHTGKQAEQLGYSQEDLANVPEGANLGLGCGNPVALAALKEGQTVIDLGSGGGIDCFLAASKVGPAGAVIGVDMTPEMITKARAFAAERDVKNVEFRLGEIEHLPVADDVADVIISNCVVNLSPNKPAVLADAFRVLRPGGRLAISDIVATAEMPRQIKDDIALLCGCVSGAVMVDDLVSMLEAAGFGDVQVTLDQSSREFIKGWAPDKGIENYVCSARIEATKPSYGCGSCCA